MGHGEPSPVPSLLPWCSFQTFQGDYQETNTSAEPMEVLLWHKLHLLYTLKKSKQTNARGKERLGQNTSSGQGRRVTSGQNKQPAICPDGAPWVFKKTISTHAPPEDATLTFPAIRPATRGGGGGGAAMLAADSGSRNPKT